MKTIFFSPYTTYRMHFQFEVPVAWNLLWRGCEVRFYSCDGLFPICDIHRQAEAGERPANACESCQQSVESLFREYGLSHEKLGKFKKTSDEIYKILGNNFIYGSEANYIAYSIYCNLLDS